MFGGGMFGGIGGLGGAFPPRRVFEEQYHCYSVAYADKAHLEVCMFVICLRLFACLLCLRLICVVACTLPLPRCVGRGSVDSPSLFFYQDILTFLFPFYKLFFGFAK